MRFHPAPASLVALIVIASAAPIGLAEAKVRPSLRLTLPSSADAGKPVGFSWQARDVPRGARLALQRQVGTAQTWKTVRSLSGRGGTGQAPALSLGVYRMRIVALAKRNKALAQQRRRLRVFGTVPLSTLAGVSTSISKGPGTFVSPSHTFAWFVRGRAEEPPRNTLTVGAAANACRSIHLDFTPEATSLLNGVVPVTLTVVRQADDPVSSAASPDVIGALDATLTPGQSWALNGQATQPTFYYVNGAASCYSATPWP